MKHSLEKELPPDGSIDAGLYVLELITPRGVTLTQEEIAIACGCTKGYIWLVEKQAMQKLKRLFEARIARGEIEQWPR